MKMETKPWVAKKSQICGPKPDLARKLPIEVRYAPHTANSRKFMIISLRLTFDLFISVKN